MYTQINIAAGKKNTTGNVSPKKSLPGVLSLPAVKAIQLTEDTAKNALFYAARPGFTGHLPFQKKVEHTLQTSGTEKEVVQPKYLRNDLKNMGSGAAGQWHQGNQDFHVTVYGDDVKESGARGFKFISNRWVSEFHVTDHSKPFGRRFYNIDTGAAMNQYNRGKTGINFDIMAADFGNAVLKGKKIYTNEEAQKAEDIYLQENKESGEKNMTVVRETAKGIAQKYVGEEIDWSITRSYSILGQVSKLLKEKMILDINPSVIKEQFDQALTTLNELALKEKEAKMELKEEKSGELLSGETEQKTSMIKESKSKRSQVKIVESKIEDQKNSGKNNTLIIYGFLIVILAIILGKIFW